MNQAAELVDLLPALQAPVHGARGEPLGRVVKLWCHPESGDIGSATLRLRKGPDQKQLRITIPWSQFRLGDNGCFELRISRAVLLSVARRAADQS